MASAAPVASAEVPGEPPPARMYPVGVRHSPLTAPVVARLRAVLARSSGRRDVFAKVGDSITVSGHFARCLTGDDIRWGSHADLLATRDFFAHTPVDDRGSTSFDRPTEAARVGWRTGRVLAGQRSPLARELDAVRPAWAVVMLGTNDTYPDAMQGYEHELRRVLTALLDRDVVPLVSTLPPRRDSLTAASQTVEMNAVVRALAAELSLPLMDLHGALEPLPHAGLNRDGVHPDAAHQDRYHGCWFDDAGLSAGMNQRNLLVLEALDRMRRLVLGDEPPEPATAVDGDGTWAHPLVVTAPGWSGDGRRGEKVADGYPCQRQPLAGPEQVFRVDVAQAGRRRLRLFGGEKLGLRWLSSPGPGACSAAARRKLDVSVQPGSYWLAIDAPSDEAAGPYLVTVVSP